jgi:hydroxyacylglutathione hydrolase
MAPNVTVVPVLQDNYSYLLDDGAGALSVVDPGDAAPVLAGLAGRAGALGTILLTHHHFDHIDGAAALAEATGATVVGPAKDRHRIDVLERGGRGVAEGDALAIGRLTARVLAVPGHTEGHIAYVVTGPGIPAAAPWLFCGDVLFSLGCGRLFEGVPAQLERALYETFGALPDGTQVYCGHEYTAANHAFASHVDPDNGALTARGLDIAALRAAGTPTIPTTLGLERATNPFLRADQPALIAAARAYDSTLTETPRRVDVLAALREMKDNFQ